MKKLLLLGGLSITCFISSAQLEERIKFIDQTTYSSGPRKDILFIERKLDDSLTDANNYKTFYYVYKPTMELRQVVSTYPRKEKTQWLYSFFFYNNELVKVDVRKRLTYRDKSTLSQDERPHAAYYFSGDTLIYKKENLATYPIEQILSNAKRFQKEIDGYLKKSR